MFITCQMYQLVASLTVHQQQLLNHEKTQIWDYVYGFKTIAGVDQKIICLDQDNSNWTIANVVNHDFLLKNLN